MVCLGVEPKEAGLKAQTNPLSYGGTLLSVYFHLHKLSLSFSLTNKPLPSFLFNVQRKFPFFDAAHVNSVHSFCRLQKASAF